MTTYLVEHYGGFGSQDKKKLHVSTSSLQEEWQWNNHQVKPLDHNLSFHSEDGEDTLSLVLDYLHEANMSDDDEELFVIIEEDHEMSQMSQINEEIEQDQDRKGLAHTTDIPPDHRPCERVQLSKDKDHQNKNQTYNG